MRRTTISPRASSHSATIAAPSAISTSSGRRAPITASANTTSAGWRTLRRTSPPLPHAWNAPSWPTATTWKRACCSPWCAASRAATKTPSGRSPKWNASTRPTAPPAPNASSSRATRPRAPSSCASWAARARKPSTSPSSTAATASGARRWKCCAWPSATTATRGAPRPSSTTPWPTASSRRATAPPPGTSPKPAPWRIT